MTSARRALVTGAAGFVGASLVRHLVAEGHHVSAIVRPGGDAWRLESVDVERHQVDLRDAPSVTRLLTRARPDWVFHLAAHGAYSWQTDREGIFASNLGGLMHLLDASADCEAFVNTGSSSEYGHVDHAPSETELPRPNSDYAAAKAAASLYASFVARRDRRRVVTLRLYSAYGPWEDERRLVPTLLRHTLRGQLPPLVAPDVARDFVYVADVVDAYVRAAVADVEAGAIFNIGSGRQTTIQELVDVARRLFDVTIEPEWGSMPDRSWDTTVWVANVERAARVLGWRARTTLENGLRKTAAWISDHDL